MRLPAATPLFIGNNPRLEAVRDGNSPRLVVITHPHPLYGGDMHNNVVVTARDAALAQGFSALRFNFRGVGLSEGVHDHGRGEGRDLETALQEAGSHPILIAYSFGSWIASEVLVNRPLPGILIAPPTGMFSFPSLKGLDIQVVVGSQDQFCDQKTLRDLVDPKRLTVATGIDHFWFGHEQKLYVYLTAILRDMASES